LNPLPFIYESIAMLHMPDIGLTEILDIVILCAIIYYILRWIRHTHAWALLKGIVLVVLIALAAYLFDLVTVIWLVQNALAMGIIALVILFQPELRKALEQLGRVHLSPADNKKGTRVQSSEEIASAVMTMSSRKTGALICVEKEVSMRDISQTGIALDAIVSRQLIANIFSPNSPLHDGAMVISNNRVTAAACILPLSSEDIDHELGTRHRAALGISEVSDALIIVVSEETGTVSVASKGELARHLAEGELQKLLDTENLEKARRSFIPWKKRKV